MNRLLRVAITTLVLSVSAALPAYATEGSAPVDAQTVADFAAATAETEAANTAHYAAVAAQVGNNISCRVERPVFLSQPEVDGRVTVKGEDTAASAITCVDLMLEATETISGELYIQWQPMAGGWTTVEKTRTPMSGRMVRGVGTAPGVVDHIYPANDPSQGRPHRACVVVFYPVPLPALCQTFLGMDKAVL